MHIISTDENQVFAAVQEWNQNDTYNLYISDTRGIYFTLAMENIKSSRGLMGNIIIELYEVCSPNSPSLDWPFLFTFFFFFWLYKAQVLYSRVWPQLFNVAIAFRDKGCNLFVLQCQRNKGPSACLVIFVWGEQYAVWKGSTVSVRSVFAHVWARQN